jgi:type I restriction enzyme S subunit
LEQLAETIFKQWFLIEANESWEEINFGAIIHQVKDRIKDSTEKAEYIKVLSAVKTGELVLSEDYFTKQVFSKDIGNYIVVKQFDFAYNPSRINIGSIGMLGEDITGAVSPVYVVFRPKKDWHFYLQFMLKQQFVKSTIEVYASGTVRQSLDYDSFSKIEIKLPPFEKVEMFNKYYFESLNKINANKKQIKTLTHLRDTLLPKLMSGDVRLKM